MNSDTVSMISRLVTLSSTAARPGVDAVTARSLLAQCTPDQAGNAFLRYTASNQPATPTPPTGPWAWRGRHKIVAAVIGFFVWAYLSGLTGSATVGLMLMLPVIGGMIGFHHRHRFRRPAPTPIATNPWPFGAERIPGYGHVAGESPLLRPETHLLGIAVLVVERIRSSPVAQGNVIVLDDLAGQVEQSLQSISHQCHRIWALRTSIEGPESRSDVGAALQSTIDQRMAAVHHDWETLLEHVAQLAELALAIDAYDKILRDLDRHHRLLADADGVPTPPISDVHWRHLQEMQANLAAQVGFINDTARRVINVDFG